MRLVYEASGKEVQVGDTVHLDGNAYTVWHFAKPHKPASSGKVFIRPISNENGFSSEYYVGVIGAKWIEREDRGEGKETKKFSNGLGSKAVTRTEFQQHWLDYSGHMFTLFSASNEFVKYYDMQQMIEDLAGKMWDSK
jgi:hypothetical protein